MPITLPSNARGPILDLTLPNFLVEVTVKIRNETTGTQLWLDIPAASGKLELELNFWRRTVRDQTGADRSALINALPEHNDLWAAQPLVEGSNVVKIYVEDAVTIQETGLIHPGTMATAAPGTTAWSTPNNAKTSDNSYATAALTTGTNSQRLIATNLGLAIPAAAIIVSVDVQFEVSSTEGGLELLDLASWVEGARSTTFTNISALSFPKADSVRTAGAAKNAYGFTTAAKANAASSGFMLSVTNNSGKTDTARIDSMALNIKYRAPYEIDCDASLRWEKGYY